MRNVHGHILLHVSVSAPASLSQLTAKKKNAVHLLKVLGMSVGLCKTTKRTDQLYISLLVSVGRIICENFNPNGLTLAEI